MNILFFSYEYFIFLIRLTFLLDSLRHLKLSTPSALVSKERKICFDCMSRPQQEATSLMWAFFAFLLNTLLFLFCFEGVTIWLLDSNGCRTQEKVTTRGNVFHFEVLFFRFLSSSVKRTFGMHEIERKYMQIMEMDY